MTIAAPHPVPSHPGDHVKIYGLASTISHDVDEWRLARDGAEAVLAEVLEDEPELEGALFVLEVELGPEWGGNSN